MSGCLVIVVAAIAILGRMLVQLAPLTLAIVAALFLAALLSPVTALARRLRAPRWLSALAGILFLIIAVAGPLTLVAERAVAQFGDLEGRLIAGLQRLRESLTAGPLSGKQLDAIVGDLTERLQSAAPDPVAGAMGALQALAAVVTALVLLFFLLRDGDGMWSWLLHRFPARSRPRADAAGRGGWQTLVAYVRGTAMIAVIDGVGIGLALVILGVPLAFPLAFLTFLLAFIPIFGAVTAGAVAVLVALVSNGVSDALLVLAAVILVQQVEGNLLEPFIIGRAVRLHPAVVLTAVTAGTLVAGIAGAVVAVPLTAVVYRITECARTYPGDDPAQGRNTGDPRSGASGEARAAAADTKPTASGSSPDPG
ncbi:AI-2E family transporter [Planomonospora parontospora subsp. parontospora]|uniref:AI-2E family transporter n=2 Tax=Planomonospora parontospora TaxID=58119 RepID=A0AA37F7T0_9ACTN|nr:AI-2E family transporter [Planomonospora parontospora]GII13151.1 AI-2E family transporter [Planomonospora parontospora subsp. parontospora]